MGQAYAPAGSDVRLPAGAHRTPRGIPSIYIAGVDDEELRAFLVHVLADLHEISKMVHAMHAELEEFRPVLAMFKPGNGASDLQRAGVWRTMRKAAKNA